MPTVRETKKVAESVVLTRAELRGMLACAWDDGYGSGFDECDENVLVAYTCPNPYREVE